MRTKLLVLIAAGLAIMLGCVETTSIEAPAEVYCNTPFQITVSTIATDSTSIGTNGHLAILIPVTWSVDSVCFDGYGNNGPGILLGWVGSGDWPANSYPPTSGYEWYNTLAENAVTGQIGETGQAIVTITPDEVTGIYQIASLAGAGQYMEPSWDGDPCSCTVEVTPLNLQQETWAHIKSGF